MKLHCHHLSESFDTVQLFVFADLHIGDVNFDEDLFFASREWVLAQPNRYCILLGDILNQGLKNSKSNVYKEKMPPSEAKEWAIDNFEPLKDRVLGIVQGNHEDRPAKESDGYPLKDLARALGKKDLFEPESMALKITFGKKRNGKRASYGVYAQHYITKSAIENIPLIVAPADLYLAAHTHTPIFMPRTVNLLDYHNEKIVPHDYWIVNPGAMMDWGGYARAKGYKPSSKVKPHLTLRSNVKQIELTA